MRQESAIPPDVLLARLAANQHGVVSLDQLRALGISSDAISRRVHAGRLHRIYRGVYAVGHPRLTHEGRWMAAVLACGSGAVLSHRSAAALWKLLPSQPGMSHVTVPSHAGRKRRKGIHLHRSTSLHPAQTTLRMGIPVTTPARTLADLRRCATEDELREARRRAELRGYHIGDAARTAPDMTRGELERQFVRLCHRHGFPRPEVAKGFEVLRFTWNQVVREPREVVVALRAALDARARLAKPALWA
jgi:hypothetical protein